MFSNHFFKRYWFKIWMSIWANLVFFSSCEFSVRPKLSFDREWGTHRITGWCRMGQAPTCLAFHCSGSLRTFLAESSALRLVFSGPPTPQTSILLCYLNEIWLSFYFDCRFFSNNYFNLKFQALIVHKPNMILWKNQQNHLIADDFITKSMGPLFFWNSGYYKA